jgi:hypothetical protein
MDKSVEPLKELIDELLKLGDSKLTVDDIMHIKVFASSWLYYKYFIYLGEYPEHTPNYENISNEFAQDTKNKKVHEIITEVLTDKIKKPKWMNFIEENEWYGECGDNSTDSVIHAVAKSKRYESIVQNTLSVLNNIQSEEVYS